MDEVPIRLYEVRVAGELDPQWSAWFLDVAIGVPDDDPDVTCLRGVLDQSALRGILNRLWDLNLTVIRVTSTVVAGSNGPGGGNDDRNLRARVG